MIPEIGLMIGVYIVARMAELMLTPRESATTRGLLVVLGLLAIGTTALVVYDLLSRGGSVPGIP